MSGTTQRGTTPTTYQCRLTSRNLKTRSVTCNLHSIWQMICTCLKSMPINRRLISQSSLSYDWLQATDSSRKHKMVSVQVYESIALKISHKTVKVKRKLDLYSVPFWEARLWSAQAWIAQFLRCNYTIPAFTSWSIHQTALPRIVITAIWLQLTTHLSTRRGWKAEFA